LQILKQDEQRTCVDVHLQLMPLFLELFRESLETASVWGRSANTSAYDYEGTTRCQAMDHGDDQKVRGEWEESAMRVLQLEGAKELQMGHLHAIWYVMKDPRCWIFLKRRHHHTG
jgi:hypothetical protein